MTAALEGGEWSAALPGRTLPPEKTWYPFTGGWVGPRTGLDWRNISSPHRDSIPDRPSRSSVAIPTELPGPYVLALEMYLFVRGLRSVTSPNRLYLLPERRIEVVRSLGSHPGPKVG